LKNPVRALPLKVGDGQIVPADQASQLDLTAAQQAEEQQQDHLLVRQRGPGFGAAANLLVDAFQPVGRAQGVPLLNQESGKGKELVTGFREAGGHGLRAQPPFAH
jgi:hypothetical protein